VLYCCVFLCGAALMIIELTGSRILAPFLGTSLVVWTSLIGIILASLSLGAWWGGTLADRHPRARLLGQIVLLAAWATAGIGLSKTWVLEFLQRAGTLHTVAIAATMALFAPAAVLLGMVPPFAVRASAWKILPIPAVRQAVSMRYRRSALLSAPFWLVLCS